MFPLGQARRVELGDPQSRGLRVAMVGDAPALARADVGIAICCWH